MLLYLDEDPYAKWSMIASLVAAGATVIGVALAGIGGAIAFRLFTVESERDKRTLERDQRNDELLLRKQASAIGFWDAGAGWQLANLSTLPIYRVSVGTYYKDLAVYFDSRPLQPFAGVLSPGQEVTFEQPARHIPGIAGIPVVKFTDNASVVWVRMADQLREFARLNQQTRAYFVEALRATPEDPVSGF